MNASDTSVRVSCKMNGQENFKHIHGTNVGPVYLQGAYDASEYFTQAGFTTVRLHDCPYCCFGVVDIPFIFPLFHLNPNAPEHYVFRPTDSYVQSVLDCGCGIVYRLGVSIMKRPEFSGYTDPPPDYEKWADICTHVIRHYNEGWANGFHHDIQYWEIWNEAENGPKQWNAPYEEFIEFFITAAKRLKANFPQLKIGGPSFNGSFVNNRDKLHTFLPALKEADCPLDFISWHAYPDRAGQVMDAAREVREILDSYGFTATESHLNEWNLMPTGGFAEMRKTPETQMAFFDHKNGPAGCSLAAVCLVAFQDLPLDMTNYYSCMNFNYGMFQQLGAPHKPFYVFKAFNSFLNTFPKRLAVAGNDPDGGLALLAGRTRDGNGLGLFAANHGSDKDRWAVSLQDLPIPHPAVRCRCIDKTRNLEPGDSDAVLTGNTLTLTLPRCSTAFIEISSSAQHKQNKTENTSENAGPAAGKKKTEDQWY